MSDSLRDQLLRAGFAEPKSKPRPKPKSGKRKQPPGKHKSGGQTASAPSSVGKPVQSEPKAGHTHVPDVPAKKKKSKKAPAVKPRAGSWSTRNHANDQPGRQPSDPADAEKRRAMKAEIQGLIDSSAVKDYKGDTVYRFALQNKIRELLVSEPIRAQLADGELAITRLNGATRIVPATTATKIRSINPQWLVFVTTDVESSSDDDDEFPIPDDLMW